MNREGRRFVHGFAGPGAVVGLPRLLREASPPVELVAHAETVLVCMAREDLAAILDAHPLLWRDVALLLLARRRKALEEMQVQAVGSVRQRVAAILLQLARSHGVTASDGLRLQLRLSQEDLAGMLGVSRQTTNKTLRALEAQGLIASSYNTITLQSIDALAG